MRMSPHLAFYKYYLGTKSRSACLQDGHFTSLAISTSPKILEPFTAPACSKSREEDHTAPRPGAGLSDGLLALLKGRVTQINVEAGGLAVEKKHKRAHSFELFSNLA